MVVLSIQQRAEWPSTLITRKHSRHKKPPKYISIFSTIHWRFRIAFFLHVYFERVFSYRWRLFWMGAPCFQCAEVQGPGGRSEYCRQLPPPTDYVRNLQSGPPSMLLLYNWKKIATQSGQSTYFVCIFNVKTTTTTTSSTIQSTDHSMNIHPWLVPDTYQVRT